MNYLILSVTAGGGHNSTAKAIKDELEVLGAEAEVLDTFDYISPALAHTIADGYLLVTEKAKKIYQIGYEIAEKRKESDHIPLPNRVMSKELADYINNGNYDAIVFTHPFAAQLTDIMKEKNAITQKTLGILTDFTFHPYWEEAVRNDYVVVPDIGLLPQARAKGFKDSQILPLGIPINPKFSQTTPKKEAREKLGLDPDKSTILIMGGSMGYGNIAETVSNIDSIKDFDFQIITVCGNNKDMENEIEKIKESASHTILVTGFVDYVSLLMDASDMIVTKPGGLTTSEALAKQLPMIIVNPIPGQEERNSEFLLNMGCAMASTKTVPVEECIYQLLSSPVRLSAMKECISSVGKPNSTKDVCKFLIDMVK